MTDNTQDKARRLSGEAADILASWPGLDGNYGYEHDPADQSREDAEREKRIIKLLRRLSTPPAEPSAQATELADKIGPALLNAWDHGDDAEIQLDITKGELRTIMLALRAHPLAPVSEEELAEWLWEQDYKYRLGANRDDLWGQDETNKQKYLNEARAILSRYSVVERKG